MSSQTKQDGHGPRFTQEQIDFVVNADGKHKQISKAFNATFNRNITERGVRSLKAKWGRYRGNHKWTLEQMTFVLDAQGSIDQVATAYKARFNVEITRSSINHIRNRYGPGQPLPDKATGRWTRDQIKFVLDACEEAQYDGIAERVKWEKIAERYNARFDPIRKITVRGVRSIRERYGPGMPLPCQYTDEQVEFILQGSGSSAEVAAAYNAHFNPKAKMSVRAVEHFKREHGQNLQLQ